MKGTLKLENPLLVDGKKVNKLEYDFNAVTAGDLMQAEREAAKTGDSIIMIPEADGAYQIAVTRLAIVKASRDVSLEDTLRIQGIDAVRLMGLGRSFLFQALDADGEETPSGQQ